MIVGMIPVYGQHREHTDQPETLAHHILYGSVIAVPVIGGQRQHAPGQRVHDIAAGRFHDHVPGEIRGQDPAGHQNFPELF